MKKHQKNHKPTVIYFFMLYNSHSKEVVMTMSHKKIKKQRTMLYFMQAAKEIVNTEGMQAITIRKVADIAGYNSATLYNYFENLDQLIAFAMIHTITDYLSDLETIINLDLNALDKYLLMWRCYSDWSFKDPEIYTYVFDSEKSDEILSHMDAYNATFPMHKTKPAKHISDLVLGQGMKRRNQLSIDPCVEVGYFKADDVSTIVNFAYIMHQGIIRRILKGSYTNDNDHVEEFLNYFVSFLGQYDQKMGINDDTVKNILEFDIHKKHIQPKR
ncbi:transcriptional regulator, TetR family [Erysipelothrix rhusiopathiae ATCC 19414]|uniref:Transcriptional regulator, TetR family n=3 Tax=Erysipelothrix rhusiopathiae TaxID=1648 RepID=E7FVL9_ERYRH|nr:transcriptional regulator, TetR family [Erysipelothrix rhusiopathiae ATCC 19414]